MPYGADVYDMQRTHNLLFKHSMNLDYPMNRLRRRAVAARVELWIRHADHIIGGCDWVDFLDFWHTLTLVHFAIDTDEWKPSSPKNDDPQRPVRILHAPNHRNVKGTRFFITAVDELRAEGEPVELVLLERVENRKIKQVMETVDIVADQLVIGWYAIFALEAMAMGKPLLCYLRADLEDFYINAGLVERGEIPIVNVCPETVKEVIRELVRDRKRLQELSRRSRSFVVKHHSLPASAVLFDGINRTIGITPPRREGRGCHELT
jgi:glycosyltransferase involved in cell wall biosynthesis